MTEIELLPAASRVIEGLRDTGYEFNTAVADIVDNSIAADATRILVRVGMTPAGEIQVSISDNGTGMDGDLLLNAMRYGSNTRENLKSLGKFGLGLKTASTAMARQLTVVSRWQNGEVFAAEWDLDYIRTEDRWLLKRPTPSRADLDLLGGAAAGGSGTVVIWRKVDRIIPRTYKQGQAARNALRRQVDELREHLRRTYVRFLTGAVGTSPIQIWLDDAEIVPWDPFGTALGSELVLDESVDVEIDGSPASFKLRAYVLPPRSELSPSQVEEARLTVTNQGFYVFREDRVISAGDWLGMFRIEPHYTLCRIDLSFDHRLDDALQIDIKKSRIRLLAALHEEVQRLIAPARNEASTRYRKNERTEIVVEGGSLHATSNRVIGNNAEKLSRSGFEVTGENEAQISNPQGKVIITIPTLTGADASGPYIVVRDDVMDGLLWQPGIVDQKKAVLLNAGHLFYQRFYLGNRDNPIAVQGANFLLWALCEAELYALSSAERDHMAAVRREVSRILRELAKELPEPETPVSIAS